MLNLIESPKVVFFYSWKIEKRKFMRCHSSWCSIYTGISNLNIGQTFVHRRKRRCLQLINKIDLFLFIYSIIQIYKRLLFSAGQFIQICVVFVFLFIYYFSIQNIYYSVVLMHSSAAPRSNLFGVLEKP